MVYLYKLSTEYMNKLLTEKKSYAVTVSSHGVVEMTALCANTMSCSKLSPLLVN